MIIAAFLDACTGQMAVDNMYRKDGPYLYTSHIANASSRVAAGGIYVVPLSHLTLAPSTAVKQLVRGRLRRPFPILNQ